MEHKRFHFKQVGKAHTATITRLQSSPFDLISPLSKGIDSDEGPQLCNLLAKVI